MSSATDRQAGRLRQDGGDHRRWLVRRQYRDASRLDERSRLHARYGAARRPWHAWVFDRLDLAPDSRILEVGCGPADLWSQNLDRVPAAVDITLSDLSVGMLHDARRRLRGPSSDVPAPRLVAAAAEALPFEDHAFDAVIANHVLYHVADVDAALSEIARVLRPQGVLYAATVGLDHMHELFDVAARCSPSAAAAEAPAVSRFSLESARPRLSGGFEDVHVERFDNPISVDAVEPLMAYLLSTEAGAAMSPHERDACVEAFGAVVERDGAFRITSATGLVVAVVASGYDSGHSAPR